MAGLVSNNSGDELTDLLIGVFSQDESEPKRIAYSGNRGGRAQGGGPSAESIQSRSTEGGSPLDNGITCPNCGALCSKLSKFCSSCATFLADLIKETQFDEIPLHPIDVDVALVIINDDSTDGARVPLNFNETVIGRSGDPRFPTDAFLSPRHARVIVEDRQLFLEDLNSLNGSFVRVRTEMQLEPGDCFLAGRQLLRFERFEQPLSGKARSADGTRYMGSPGPGGEFKLVQIGIGNTIQNIYCLPENGVVFGRETGDIVFNRDRFMSGRHAQIYPREDGNYYLIDLNSSNGTWMRTVGKQPLFHGDLIFLGQQLFRVEAPSLA